MRTISYIVIFGIIGVFAGYLLFGKGIDIMTLLKVPQSGLGRVGQRVMGYEQIRQNILIAGGVGALVGLVLSLAGRRPRR